MLELSEVGSLMSDVFIISLKLAGPCLIISMVVGMIISIFQAATQIHEQTLIDLRTYDAGIDRFFNKNILIFIIAYDRCIGYKHVFIGESHFCKDDGFCAVKSGIRQGEHSKSHKNSHSYGINDSVISLCKTCG